MKPSFATFKPAIAAPGEPDPYDLFAMVERHGAVTWVGPEVGLVPSTHLTVARRTTVDLVIAPKKGNTS